MPISSIALYKDFINHINDFENTRISFENSFNSGHLSSSEIRQAYSGIYLDLFTEFEFLLESLFIGILSGEIKHKNRAIKRNIYIQPKSEVEKVLLGDKKNYLDWLPYANYTIPKAKLYFVDGKPFTLLNDIDKGKLGNYHKIRNAIAHKSKKAIKDFNEIIGNLTLLPIEKTPPGYLRSIPNRTVGKTQLEIAFEDLKVITNKLCN